MSSVVGYWLFSSGIVPSRNKELDMAQELERSALLHSYVWMTLIGVDFIA